MVIIKKARQELVLATRTKVLPHVARWPHIALCGPSGCGKTTLTRTHPSSIIKLRPDIYDFSVSGATRDRRGSEINGLDYHFMSIADFGMNDFFETNEYAGNKKLYGTLVSEIERIALYLKKRIVFDIDINGAMALQEEFGDDLLTAFLNTSEDPLRARLIGRMEVTGETMVDVEKRLVAAEIERGMVRQKKFIPDMIIPYDDLLVEEAVHMIFIEAQQKMLKIA